MRKEERSDTPDRPFVDVDDQYRTVIFYHGDEQKHLAAINISNASGATVGRDDVYRRDM